VVSATCREVIDPAYLNYANRLEQQFERKLNLPGGVIRIGALLILDSENNRVRRVDGEAVANPAEPGVFMGPSAPVAAISLPLQLPIASLIADNARRFDIVPRRQFDPPLAATILKGNDDRDGFPNTASAGYIALEREAVCFKAAALCAMSAKPLVVASFSRADK